MQTLYVEPTVLGRTAMRRSFNSRVRDEFLALEIFDNLQELLSTS